MDIKGYKIDKKGNILGSTYENYKKSKIQQLKEIIKGLVQNVS